MVYNFRGSHQTHLQVALSSKEFTSGQKSLLPSVLQLKAQGLSEGLVLFRGQNQGPRLFSPLPKFFAGISEADVDARRRTNSLHL